MASTQASILTQQNDVPVSNKSSSQKATCGDHDELGKTILSQSARMAWQVDTDEGDSLHPESSDFYPRHFSRQSPPPDEISSDDDDITEKISSIKNKHSNGNNDKYNDNNRDDKTSYTDAKEVDEEYMIVPPPDASRDYRHKVYESQSTYSSVIGYLIPGIAVDIRHNNVNSDSAQWINVRCHESRGKSDSKFIRDGWGWCIRYNSSHVFVRSTDEIATETEKKGMVDDSILEDFEECDNNVEDEEVDDDVEDEILDQLSDNFSQRLGSNGADTWYQHFDINGLPYYVNPVYGVSSWEAPEWVEEVDNNSGAR
jgi:hypothetical protein